MGLFLPAVAGVAAAVYFADCVPEQVTSALPAAVPGWAVAGIAGFAVVWLVSLALRGKRQPVKGAVIVTGSDSGMGEVTAVHLAKLGFHVYAGTFLKDSPEKLREQVAGHPGADRLVPVSLDVTSKESVAAAVRTVEAGLAASGEPLVGIINCAGMGFTGPAEYFPMDMYKQQMDVNFFGYVAVVQAFMPLLRKGTQDPASRRGRVILVGTGGGVLSPAPPLLTAYMASKWAGEAFCQGLRFEMQLTKQRIDACMINPGFIKPTNLMAGGKALLDRAWRSMPPQAKDEYSHLVDKFLAFSEAQPGTHPKYVALAMEEAMTASTPNLNYKVGPDSKASPFVGMLPTPLREWIVRTSMYGKV